MKTLTSHQKIATAPTYGRLPYAALLGHSVQLPPAITAAERGPEWMATYGCTPNCTMDHPGADGQPGWHGGTKVAVSMTGELNDSERDNQPEDLLTARVVTVNDSAEIFGIESTLWVQIIGESMELSLPQVDHLIGSLETFLPQLRVLRAQLAEVGKGDVPRDEQKVARWRAAEYARTAAERAAIEIPRA